MLNGLVIVSYKTICSGSMIFFSLFILFLFPTVPRMVFIFIFFFFFSKSSLNLDKDSFLLPCYDRVRENYVCISLLDFICLLGNKRYILKEDNIHAFSRLIFTL